MRLLFVIDSLGSGGAQRQMVALMRGLRERGHEVHLFLYHPAHQHFRAPVEEAGIQIHAVHKRTRLGAGVLLALLRCLRTLRPDAVVAFLDTPNLYAELAGVAVRGLPVVVSERSAFPVGRLPLRRSMLQQGHRLATHIVVNSHSQRRRMIERAPWMAAKISTIVNGVDVGAPLPPPPPAPGGAFVPRFLVVGRVSPEKNADGIIGALKHYRDRHGRARTPHVRWAGRVDPAAGSYYEQVCALLSAHDLEAQWTWLGERADVGALLATHDALLHPAHFEGFPNAICEALAAGRPVIGSTFGDIPDLVEHGTRGFTVDAADVEGLAETMHAFSTLTAAERDAMGRAAWAFAQQHLGLGRMVDEYEALLGALTSPENAQHRLSPPKQRV